MAHMFGARCSTELTEDITHVVAAKVCDPPAQISGYSLSSPFYPIIVLLF